jgi:hypothetical protein
MQEIAGGVLGVFGRVNRRFQPVAGLLGGNHQRIGLGHDPALFREQPHDVGAAARQEECQGQKRRRSKHG